MNSGCGVREEAVINAEGVREFQPRATPLDQHVLYNVSNAGGVRKRQRWFSRTPSEFGFTCGFDTPGRCPGLKFANALALIFSKARAMQIGLEESRMQRLDVNKTAAAWSSLAGKIFVPHSEDEYRQLVALLDSMIDEVGEDESHPLASLMEIVGVLIEKYEVEHVPELI